MSDTPRTDMAQYFNYDDSDKPEPLGMVDVEFTRKLETELNTAIVNEAFAENKVYMIEKQLKQANERIKQLEEAGDKLHWAWSNPFDPAGETIVKNWTRAKEDKP